MYLSDSCEKGKKVQEDIEECASQETIERHWWKKGGSILPLDPSTQNSPEYFHSQKHSLTCSVKRA